MVTCADMDRVLSNQEPRFFTTLDVDIVEFPTEIVVRDTLEICLSVPMIWKSVLVLFSFQILWLSALTLLNF